MDLAPHVEDLRRELLAASEPDEATAQRLSAAVTSTARLAIFDVLTAAMDEITRELAPGSVEVRLRGRDPVFVVTHPGAADEEPTAHVPVSRINFRPPERLKRRIDAAAGREGLSTNAWLVRVAGAALTGAALSGDHRGDGHVTAWVG